MNELVDRLECLRKQLINLSTVYRLVGDKATGDEFERLAIVEVDPCLAILKRDFPGTTTNGNPAERTA